MEIDLVVVGQGYVGLPLAHQAVESGFSVVGLDLNQKAVESLNSGSSHVDDISDDQVAGMISRGYRATSDPDCLSAAANIVICVPTPLGEAGSPDLSAVEGAIRDILTRVKKGALVVLESTTYPGTTDEVLLPILQSTGLLIDRDFYLAFSPERIDPGNQLFGIKNTPKVVGGVSSASTERAVDFYRKIVDSVVPVRGSKEAETAKLLENTYRHINIALVNEMSKFCKELDIDLWDVIDAAKTKPFGFQAFYPGPGVGGHCIPIDPNYLSFHVRKSLKYPFRFVELAEEINNSMPSYIVSRVQALLNQQKMSVNGSRILLLGVTYKANIADQRESPSTEIANLLTGMGANVSYHDPYVPEWTSPEIRMSRVDDVYQANSEADIVVLLQAHSDYDIPRLGTESGVFFDTRGASDGVNTHRL
ncbi:nucleotide sugar dehydrogenase [Arthrobacter sp. 260]|uniref:nucleotide sugar dehydrogenase n=1 Tax=Arthrobacter sp. 260 TaxID=2735314 RepID=UPI00149178D4|nr:nucleotide sugar dehydrogenase [Arthrobacter sp. 260]NOJ60388.1 nucleotide sugar dehydrogenase [Arthrobacter sp. 260]